MHSECLNARPARHKLVTTNSGDIARFVVDFEVSPVPEPAAFSLFVAGLAVVGAATRSRRAVRPA